MPVQPCRTVTSEEIDHFREFGWVKLKSYVDPDCLSAMLANARSKMGEDADSNARPGEPLKAESSANGDGEVRGTYFNAEYNGGLKQPLTHELIHQAGKNARLLMGRKSDVGARYYSDFLVPKLPSSKKTRHGGNGPTAFHQDFITFAVDRSGGMTFWIPLEAYGKDSGTMSFVSGSHRLGVLGDYSTYGNGGAFDAYPELRDMDMSDAMTYELGDITVHSHLTIHGAGSNLTDRPRWAYLLVVQPADICWNGSPTPNFDTSKMTPWQRLDDERFPVIG